MTQHRGPDVRDRLRRLDLPPAPESLRGRVVEVTATRPTGRASEVARIGRLLLPVAAALLIGGIAGFGGGNRRPPSDSPSSPPPAGPAIATLVVDAAIYECCFDPGGRVFRVELQGPGGPWSGDLAGAELGAPTSVDPSLPAKLAAGAYSLRTEIHVFGDVIYPGETGPRDYGVSATCTSDFVVTPDTRIVAVTLGYWRDRCAAGTVAAPDARLLASVVVVPSISGECGADVGGCDYRLAVSGPGGTWGAVIQTVKPASELVGSELTTWLSPGAYHLEALSHRMSREPEPGAGHQSEIELAATCSVDFTIAPDSTNVEVFVDFRGETCKAQADVEAIGTAAPSGVGPIATPAPTEGAVQPAQPFLRSFSPPYGDAPPAGPRLRVDAATLSADGRRLTIDFVGSGSYRPDVPCASYAEPWVAIDGETLLVAIVGIHVPAPSACPLVTLVGFAMRYVLELPAEFTGTTMRDLGSGVEFDVGG